jgi:DNA-binding NarL/FixJ family response regulator
MIRVLLVDDQALIREGMRRVLDTDAAVTVVGECEDGDEVVDAVERCSPDVIVMDVRMRRVDGAAATAAVREIDGPPVLVLTTFDDDETVAAALGAGASGFLLKDAPGEDILRAIHAVAEGESWLDPRVAGRVLDAYRGRARPATSDVDLSVLTPRETDVLRVVGRGATNAEAAAELHVSEATVKTHLGNVLSKLHLRDRAAAIVLAHDHQLV